MAKKNKDSVLRPNNLAFSRAINLSEGKLNQTDWNIRGKAHSPLCIYDKAVLASKAYDMSDQRAEIEALQPNPQKGQTCALSSEHDTLVMHFTMKVFPVASQLHSCPDEIYHAHLKHLFEHVQSKEIYYKLAQRYINNIANARFLWRNRRSARNIETIVSMDGKSYTFNSKNFYLDKFVYDDAHINEIARSMANAFRGTIEFLDLDITCYVELGKGMEVFPSQEMTIDGNDGKILFSYEGSAGIHSQKIGNAIRTIDTWYPNYDKYEFPIPIEPYGVKRSLGLAFRISQSFYKLIDKYISNLDEAPENDLLYILAVIIRGGLFGMQNKAKKERE